MTWPRRPALLEVDARVWAAEVSARLGRVPGGGLGDVPAEEWDALTAGPLDALWLRGVWERSPCAALVAAEDPAVAGEARAALPDLAPADFAGSPSAVHRYTADALLGGAPGLAAARKALAERGLRLVLDYAPHQTAVDHPWVFHHPERFLQGREADLRRTPGRFFEAEGLVFAHARGAAHAGGSNRSLRPDAAQLHAFRPDVRLAAVETLRQVAAQCDGVVCEGAALVLNAAFAATWGDAAGDPPAEELWAEVIPAVREGAPGFLFVADAAPDREWDLMQLGFDLVGDGRLYDRLLDGGAEGVGLHLLADPAFQDRLVRYLEPRGGCRAAEVFPGARGRAAAVVAATLPGAKLFRDGQADGRRRSVPEALGRRPAEEPDRGLRAFYAALLAELRCEALRDGEWRGCLTAGWPDNSSHRSLVAWCWQSGGDRRVVAVNLSDAPAQGLVPLSWDDLAGRPWRLIDAFAGASFVRDGAELRAPGLYVGLGGWGFHLLRVEAV